MPFAVRRTWYSTNAEGATVRQMCVARKHRKEGESFFAPSRKTGLERKRQNHATSLMGGGNNGRAGGATPIPSVGSPGRTTGSGLHQWLFQPGIVCKTHLRCGHR